MSTSVSQTSDYQDSASTGPAIEVEIRQNGAACWLYAWDRERDQLRLRGLHPAPANLSADLAFLRLDQETRVPVSVLTGETPGLVPGALVTVRLLGAFQSPSPAGQKTEADSFPLTNWHLVAVPAVDGFVPSLPPLAQLRTMLLTGEDTGTAVWYPAPIVVQRLREARVWLKRAQRARKKRFRSTNSAEKAVAWRAIEGLTADQRAQVEQAGTIAEMAAFLQAEQLIHFVPQRFQEMLSRLLLDDERLLVFLERPLLRHSRGWPGRRSWRANAGLLLVTDRQVLWVRDFFSPDSPMIPTGYIARGLPLERLGALSLLPAQTPASTGGFVLSEEVLPYPRLVFTVGSRGGQEHFDMAFPRDAITEKALARLVPLLSDFLPRTDQPDRRVRRVPVIAAWLPQGTEARQLDRLGGVVHPEIKQFLTTELAALLKADGEEVLVSGLIPALAEHRTPPRLVALTRRSVLVFEALPGKSGRAGRTDQKPQIHVRRSELADISSVQLSYSLLGSSLSLFVPQTHGTKEQVIPFQSPAITWFLPLFTRLRLALSLPFKL